MVRKAIIVVLTMLAVASAVVFPLSLPWAFGYTRGGYSVEVNYGSLLVFVDAPDTDAPAPPNYWFWAANVLPPEVVESLGPYGGRLFTVLPRYFHSGSLWVLNLPLWTVFVGSTAYPTIALIRGPLRRWRRRRKGLCLKCSYNLTGNESGVCPECGTKIAQPDGPEGSRKESRP